MAVAAILLGAGMGTRMNSDLPKVLHQVAGAPLLHHAMMSAGSLDPARIVVVTGHGGAAVAASARAFREDTAIADQGEMLGTGHAVRQALPALDGFEGDILVLYGDTPFIRGDTLERMMAARAQGADVVVLGFEAAVPGGYGRLKLGADGGLEAIVEAKEASAEELAITLCNSGVMALGASLARELVPLIGNANAKGEYYLTDLVALARARGLGAAAVSCPEEETLGVNSRADLAAAEAAFQARVRAEAMENGVTLTAPETVFFAFDTVVGRDSVIGPNVVFGPGVTVESGAEILPFCHLADCHIAAGATVGPFARLRGDTEIGEEARVGNFVELKAVRLGQGAKVSHLSYLGDAEVGARANIGAGTITCNYDGVFKHRTEIGEDAFIGSNSSLVAPVRIGAGALTGSGSVVTSDVPPGAAAVERAPLVIREEAATRRMERLKAARAEKEGN